MGIIASYVRKLSVRTSILIATLVAIIGLWLFIEPIKDAVKELLGLNGDMAQIILGIVLMYVAYRIWKVKVI